MPSSSSRAADSGDIIYRYHMIEKMANQKGSCMTRKETKRKLEDSSLHSGQVLCCMLNVLYIQRACFSVSKKIFVSKR